MKYLLQKATFIIASDLLLSACVVERPAPPIHEHYRPTQHPAYLHALSDLRAARWEIAHRPADNYAMDDNERFAIDEIGAAIAEIKHAAIDDGKDINEHPPAEMSRNHEGRLHQALDLLRQVRSDVAREEDDSHTQGLQYRSLQYVDGAIRAVEHALRN